MTSGSSSREISNPAVLATTPLVSVKMITYNHEPYLARAVEGVLGQKTEFPIELVIGEDHSTDRTREIALHYQRTHPDTVRVLVSDENLGATRNGRRTTEACRGEYLALCEGDDFWQDPRKLQMQVERFRADPDLVLVAHRANRIDTHDILVKTFPRPQPEVLRPRDIIIKGGGFFATSSMMLKTRLLEDLPGWFYQFPAGDVALVNLAIHRGKVGFLNEVMSVYREGVRGSWSWRLDSISKKREHLSRIDQAYRALLEQERRWRHWYHVKRIVLHWSMVALYLKAPVKRALRHAPGGEGRTLTSG